MVYNLGSTALGTANISFGAAIGTTSYIADYVATKVNLWIEELHPVTLLVAISRPQPYSACSTLTHGLYKQMVVYCPDYSLMLVAYMNH